MLSSSTGCQTFLAEFLYKLIHRSTCLPPMSNSSPLALRSRIKALLDAAGMTCIVTFWFLIALWLFSGILFHIYSALLIGKPSEVTCQDVDSIRIDCTLKYQALLRSSEQKIIDVQRLDIDQRISSSEDRKTEYVAVLRTQNGEHSIKTYSNHNHPELEVLNHRLNKFFENPEDKLTVPIQCNPWEPIITLVGFLVLIVFMFTALVIYLIIVVLCTAVFAYFIHFISWFSKQLLHLPRYFKILGTKISNFIAVKIHRAITRIRYLKKRQRK